MKGELRLAVNGATYAMPFAMAATTGNRGKGVTEALQSGITSGPTLIVDPLDIIRVR